MSGVTPLIDTLLATRLAQRVDLVPFKGQIDIADPRAVQPVDQVNNDVRLSSRAALQQQLGVVLSAHGDSGRPPPTPSSGAAVTLSAVARTIGEVLDLPGVAGQKVLGSEALWPDSQPPQAQLLTATLARTVANSGLFYESHLQQYTAGTRTLAQMAREPQAGLDATVKMSAAVSTVRVAGPDPGSEAVAQVPGAENRGASSVGAAHSDNPVTTAIHPAAMGLVRQQLELLALPVFRWSGEAWPGTPIDWEINEERGERGEREERPAAAGGEAAQRIWATRLAMTLPSLGALEVRLSLAGSTLQLQLSARENATLALLSDESNKLPQRFAALAMQLTGLRIGGLAPTPA